MSQFTPQGWATAKLGEILEVIRGVSYQKGDAKDAPHDGFLPVLRANNIQDGILVFDDLVYVPENCVSNVQRLRIGDIVIAASSGSRSVVGKAAPLTKEWKGSFGAFCYGLRPRDGINAEYLNYYLQSSEYRQLVSALSAGININNLRREHIDEMVLALPPLNEQRRIVAKLDALFERSRNIRDKLKKIVKLGGSTGGQLGLIDKFEQALLSKAFQGELVAQDPSDEPATFLLERIQAERAAQPTAKRARKSTTTRTA